MTASYAAVDLSNPIEVYEQWLVDPLFRPWAAILLEYTGIECGDRVLDIACGTGILARLAAERTWNPNQVVGVDTSAGMLRVARRVAPEIDWREGTASNLPLAEGEAFEAVLCHQGLQFFPDRAASVRQMHRALTLGGRLGVATWSAVPRGGLLHELHLVAERHLGPIVDRRHVLTDEVEMHHLLADAGFREVWVDTMVAPVTFPDGGIFLQLNVRALMGMSPRAATMTESERARVMSRLLEESTAVARADTTADGITFTIGSILATARR